MPAVCCAVFGNPIAHSLSPQIHQLFAKQCGLTLHYEKVEVPLAQFEQQVMAFFEKGGKGLNITLPFKERAFALAEVRTKRAQKARAANTLWMHNGKLHADNTDGVGLVNDLKHFVALENKSILILGAGGAVRGIIGPLLDAGVGKLTVCNRTFAKAQALQNDFPEITLCERTGVDDAYDILINGTSASLNNESFQLQPFVVSHPFCYDLVYASKGNTPFVEWATAQGYQATDGMGMLIEQAAEAFSIWHGVRPSTVGIQKQLQIA